MNGDRLAALDLLERMFGLDSIFNENTVLLVILCLVKIVLRGGAAVQLTQFSTNSENKNAFLKKSIAAGGGQPGPVTCARPGAHACHFDRRLRPAPTQKAAGRRLQKRNLYVLLRWQASPSSTDDPPSRWQAGSLGSHRK
jgi:hypothetical protein